MERTEPAAEEVSYRRAALSDIDELAGLCREGFRKTLRWQAGGTFARQWWQAAIESTCAEVWLCVAGGRTAGAAVLVFDEQGWARERTARCGRRPNYVLAILRAPQMVPVEILNRLRLRRAVRASKLRGIPQPTEPRTWMEMLLVSPAVQGKQVATRLKRHCESRSVALGCKILESSVDPGNVRMRRLNERMGYQHTRQTKAGCIYSKKL